MNPPSLAKALERISDDRRRARVHRQMAILWIAVALLLVGFILANRYLGWDYGPLIGPFSGVAVIAALLLFFRKAPAVNLQDVARDVERSDPKLNTLLLAAYEQQQAAGAEGLSYLQERVVLEALEANRRSPWGEKFAQRFFFTALGHACAVLVFVVALGAAFAMAPGGVAAHVFQRTVQVTPGNAEIERGSALAVMAKFPNPAPAEVKLVMTPKNGPAQVLRMDRSLEDPVFGAGFAEVKEDFKYQIQFGEKKSEEFTIKVFEYPALKRADANLKFPEFTGLAEKRIDDTRRVTAVEGTVVDYRLELNKPVKTAALQPKEGAAIELQPDATHPNIYHAKIDLRASQKLALRLKDADGRTNKFDELVLEAVANKQPDLKIVFPRGDQRVSAIEELALQAEARDDFGLGAYGLAYSVGGGDPVFVQIGASGNANEKKALEHLLRLEALKATTDQLISYYAWAEDRGPDGAVRRSESDLFFAEIRPFEEIYRRGDDAQQQQQQQQQQGQQGGQQSPGEKLAELQKEIVNATWKLRRTESTNKPSANFKKDAGVVRDSQEQALDQADAMIERLRDPRMKGFAETATKEMRVALDRLSEAVSRNSPGTLDKALSAERAAYQALLKLQAREYQVSRQRGGGGGGGGGQQQRGGAQLDELELRDEENRYESQRQAAAPQDAARREETQVLNRLKELARRQGDVNERMKELQAALQEAQTEQEKEELRRRLKRLQEEQQEMVRDMDELQQRMAQNQNQNQNSSQSQNQGQQADMAQARQQLEQARQQAQQTSEQMQKDALNQAVSSGTRTERDLQKLSEDFQQSSSQRFSDEMRNMRRQARELAEKQQDLANKLNDMKNPPQTQRRSLAGDGLKEEITAGLNRQRTNYANIVERMKQVSQDAETAEPLLSRQLEESVRKLGQENTEQALERAEELVRRNFPVQAGPLENQARQQIEQLRQSVDQAARRILGDETEALRTASRELDELARRLESEAPTGPGRDGTNTVARASAGNREGEQRQPGEGRQEQQQQQANSRQRGQGQQPGEGQGDNAQAQTQENQEGQEGQQGGGRNGQRQQAQARPQRGQGDGQGENRDGGDNQDPNAGPRNFFDNLRADGARNNRGGAVRSGPAREEEGPITGEDFRQWADRLRDVQDMLDEPNLRNELNGILDRARNLRSDFKRHSKTPEWNLLQTQLLNPLVEVRQRVAEELARRNASGVAPLDRDPVPGRYSELVSRYYQTLGEGGAVTETKKPQ